MKLPNNNEKVGAKKRTPFKRICHLIHRDVSFFFAGMVIIYALSGLFMNHCDTINPSTIITQKEFVVEKSKLAEGKAISQNTVLEMLESLEESDNLTQYYFPDDKTLKIFLKGGSSVVVNMENGNAKYEQLRRRPIISSMVQLHFNPGSWWTYFADAFAIGLIIITLTGVFMVKKEKIYKGRAGVELILGILVPLIFLFL